MGRCGKQAVGASTAKTARATVTRPATCTPRTRRRRSPRRRPLKIQERAPAGKPPRAHHTPGRQRASGGGALLRRQDQRGVGNPFTWGCSPFAQCDFRNVEIGELAGVQIDESSLDRAGYEPIACIGAQGEARPEALSGRGGGPRGEGATNAPRGKKVPAKLEPVPAFAHHTPRVGVVVRARPRARATESHPQLDVCALRRCCNRRAAHLDEADGGFGRIVKKDIPGHEHVEATEGPRPRRVCATDTAIMIAEALIPSGTPAPHCCLLRLLARGCPGFQCHLTFRTRCRLPRTRRTRSGQLVRVIDSSIMCM